MYIIYIKKHFVKSFILQCIPRIINQDYQYIFFLIIVLTMTIAWIFKNEYTSITEITCFFGFSVILVILIHYKRYMTSKIIWLKAGTTRFDWYTVNMSMTTLPINISLHLCNCHRWRYHTPLTSCTCERKVVDRNDRQNEEDEY